MLSLFTPQATCTANRFGAALTSTPGSRSHDEVIEDGRKVLSLTGPPREPIGPGGPAGPVSPCKEQGWSQGVCLGPLRQPPPWGFTVQTPSGGFFTLSPGGPAGPGGPMGPTLP